MAEEIHDVLGAGGEPVGLAMAAMLGRARHKVALFERWPTRYGLPRVGGIDAEMMRIFHSLGMGGHWFDDAILRGAAISGTESAVRSFRTCDAGRPNWKCQAGRGS